MIAFVSGRVAALAPDAAVVEVGGVGLSLQCTPTTLASLQVGEPVRLASSLVVREESLTLYGFADEDERGCFELLQTASGVGPRLAQAMLAVHSPDALRRAVSTEDLGALTRLGGPVGSSPARPAPAAAPWRDQLHAALVGLGWPARDAEAAIVAVAPADPGAEPDVRSLLRDALKVLGRTRPGGAQ
jgi:Holliday junction DNA helicase RuvA